MYSVQDNWCLNPMTICFTSYGERSVGRVRCNDNNMHGVAWAQVHSISFPADRNVNFHGQSDSDKEIEFRKCSFQLLNVICRSKNQIYGSIKFATGVNLACLLSQFGSVNKDALKIQVKHRVHLQEATEEL